MTPRLKWILILWLMPWASILGFYQAAYHPEMGELIPHAYIPEFRRNLGNLDRRHWVENVDSLNPLMEIEVDADRGLLLIGDSFGGIMNHVFQHWFPQDRKWGYQFDSNHIHQHWSPRKVVWDKLQDSTQNLDWATDVYLVELEHQGGVSSMQDFREKERIAASSWQHPSAPATGPFMPFLLNLLFPDRMSQYHRQINLGTPVADDIPMKLTDGSSVGSVSLMTALDPAWRGIQRKWIQNAVRDYQMIDSLCTERGLNFTVVHIPDRSTLYAEWIVGADTTEMRAHYRAFEHAVDSAGIRQIHALNHFDAAHKAGETNLFLLHDNHWNCRGVSVIARVMLDELDI